MMKKQAVVALVLMLCGVAFGQNGALMGWQGGAPSDILVMGPGGMIGHDISLLMGGLAPARGQYVPQGYGYSFQTGPNLNRLNQNNYSKGANFGPGGAFDAYNRTAAWCTNQCHFSGTFVSAQLTRATLSDGTYVYTLTGELTGTYTTDDGTTPCRAYVTVPVFDEKTLIFQGMTSLSYGGLQIVYQPN